MSTVASVGPIFSIVFLISAIACDVPQYIPVGPVVYSLDCWLSFRFSATALSNVASSFSFSHGFTMKSNAPLFIPSTASEMSA